MIKNKCVNCDREISKKAVRCLSCSSKHSQKLGLIGMIGKKHSEATKRKISHPCSEETKKKISLANLREKNGQWKGGRIIHKGYIYVRCNNTYRKEHRLIIEKKINRSLRKSEVVHHKDTDKQNNNPRNLLLLKNQKEHIKLHLQ